MLAMNDIREAHLDGPPVRLVSLQPENSTKRCDRQLVRLFDRPSLPLVALPSINAGLSGSGGASRRSPRSPGTPHAPHLEREEHGDRTEAADR
jgi:hypothetical protein